MASPKRDPPAGAVKDQSPVVITGPSGCGKSTLLATLFSRHPQLFAFSVSHTTRRPRQTEQAGRDYHFVERGQFEAMRGQGDFVEWAEFGGNLYGTSRRALDDIVSRGRIPVLDVERQGVLSLRRALKNARYVFVKPPSIDSLRSRLTARGTESEESMRRRLEAAISDMQWAEENLPSFDSIVVNDNVEQAYNALESFIFSNPSASSDPSHL